MSLSRLSQKKSNKKRIFPVGFFEQFFKGAVAFFTAGGIILCSLDAPLFVGVSMSLTSPIFLIFSTASLIIGFSLAMNAVQKDKANRKGIVTLKNYQEKLRIKRNEKINFLVNELAELETALVTWQQHSKIQNINFQRDIRNLRQLTLKLKNESYQSFEEAEALRLKVKGYVKLLQKRLVQQFAEEATEEQNAPSSPVSSVNQTATVTRGTSNSFYRNLKKLGNRSMVFLSGVSTIVGLAGTIVGVMNVAFLPLLPLFWLILAGVGLLAIATGALTCYIDFKLTREQENQINTLKASNHQMEKANIKIGSLKKQVNVMTSFVKVCTDKIKAENQVRSTSLFAKGPHKAQSRPGSPTPTQEEVESAQPPTVSPRSSAQ